MLKRLLFLVLAALASAAIARMSISTLQLWGLIVAIPFTIYAIRMVLTLEV